jgi:hypothetical protein
VAFGHRAARSLRSPRRFPLRGRLAPGFSARFARGWASGASPRARALRIGWLAGRARRWGRCVVVASLLLRGSSAAAPSPAAVAARPRSGSPLPVRGLLPRRTGLPSTWCINPSFALRRVLRPAAGAVLAACRRHPVEPPRFARSCTFVPYVRNGQSLVSQLETPGPPLSYHIFT